eukprot:CAMPEP_0119527908 /NCGR_PEP_ID=MMETSP1344-20130328/42212_1 /TAXON_ID=236787 /ORGANISM="Florenciella parvula, Strain CCMP2471" /LENGTH=86 /DNA_ID=CAMNT_0007567179 /DNA_START=1 /DNA_END=258 /DNA_ORIENTATION=+
MASAPPPMTPERAKNILRGKASNKSESEPLLSMLIHVVSFFSGSSVPLRRHGFTRPPPAPQPPPTSHPDTITTLGTEENKARIQAV